MYSSSTLQEGDKFICVERQFQFLPLEGQAYILSFHRMQNNASIERVLLWESRTALRSKWRVFVLYCIPHEALRTHIYLILKG
jgi:hypothetical protein